MSELAPNARGILSDWAHEDVPVVDIQSLITVHHAIMDSKGFHELPGNVTERVGLLDIAAPLTQQAGLAPLVEKLGEIAQAIRKDVDTYEISRMRDELVVVVKYFMPNMSGVQYVTDTGDRLDTPLATSRTAIAGRLVLLMTEIGEALEALRKGDLLGFIKELCDILLRLMDIVGELERNPEFEGLDFTKEVLAKLKANMDRPHMHGRNA